MQEHLFHLECSLMDLLYYPVEIRGSSEDRQFDIADQETSEGLF